MHLPRHTIESHAAVPLFQHASFCSPNPPTFHRRSTVGAAPSTSGADAGASSENLSQPAIFSCASISGFMVAQTDPLKLVAHRSWSSSQGGLSHAVPVQHTSLLLLVGGGRVPRFAPNKVVLWDEAAEYAARPPASAARELDSDEEDEFAYTASRCASTIFSAGSEFDAYGKHRSDESQPSSPAQQNSRRATSPADSLRFSPSSLVHADDVRGTRDPADPGADAIVPQIRQTDESALDCSIEASSLGIGRLQASHLSSASDRPGTDSVLFDDDDAGTASSTQAHSIMASSANLADPFAEDESESSTVKLHPAIPDPSSDGLDPVEPTTTSSGAAQTSFEPLPSQQRLFSRSSVRQTRAALVDSVSSMATTATDATNKASRKILHGREVAELEFSEIVRGIYASSIPTCLPNHKRDSTKGKGRAAAESSHTSRTEASGICVVLVVLLSSKAVIFELSPSSTAHTPERLPTDSAWKIHKKATVQTYPNLKGLGSVAPFYEGSATESRMRTDAIVAVPGRQKGHVQLLHIKLQGQTGADGIPPSSKAAASSVGAASMIVAHESSIAAIALSPNGKLLATASSKGTLIRVWSNNISGSAGSRADSGRAFSQASGTSTPGRTGFGASLIRELRRGTDAASILSIAFAHDASLVAAASDKGTIHIFRVVDPETTAQAIAREANRSFSSASSRATNLGRAAAQYLPAGFGGLAGQIPPSVLPQYLKSEWSTAQFRIPLKSFGASSRHYSAPSTTDDSGMDSGSTAPSAPIGTEKSTEGAWAQMRSRIRDIRKGEASVEEKIFLCWIVEAGPASDAPSTTKGSRTETRQSHAAKTQSQTAPSSGQVPSGKGGAHSHGRDSQHCYHLIAVTTSGGWYKLAVAWPKDSSEEEVSGSTVLDMYRRDASPRSERAGEKSKAMECRLVEFRPMIALLDGWRAQ